METRLFWHGSIMNLMSGIEYFLSDMKPRPSSCTKNLQVMRVGLRAEHEKLRWSSISLIVPGKRWKRPWMHGILVLSGTGFGSVWRFSMDI